MKRQATLLIAAFLLGTATLASAANAPKSREADYTQRLRFFGWLSQDRQNAWALALVRSASELTQKISETRNGQEALYRTPDASRLAREEKKLRTAMQNDIFGFFEFISEQVLYLQKSQNRELRSKVFASLSPVTVFGASAFGVTGFGLGVITSAAALLYEKQTAKDYRRYGKQAQKLLTALARIENKNKNAHLLLLDLPPQFKELLVQEMHIESCAEILDELPAAEALP